MRSLLFVPGDNAGKLAKGLEAGADALIVDLEDSVAPDAKPRAREVSAGFLTDAARLASRPRLYVRVNALDTGLLDDDLEAVVPAAPDGIMLPKSRRGADVALVDARLAAVEALAGRGDGATTILALATESGEALFGMGSYAGASARLAGITWGAEDLSADVGATANRDETGRFTDLYRLARALCLAAAASAEVIAIDTVFTNYHDTEGLRTDCQAAVRDGFSAKMAIHPAQVAVINEVFTPSEADIAEAKAVIDALAGSKGVAGLSGRMLDRPHLKRAERLLARARAAGLVTVRE